MKDDNYYAVFGWMINNLHLKGMEKDAFAIIYGFSQDGKSSFSGSYSYLSAFISCSRRTAINIIDELERDGFIAKQINDSDNAESNSYISTVKYINGEVARIVPSEKISLPQCKNFTRGGEKTAPNNNIDNYLNNDEKKDISSVPSDISKEKEPVVENPHVDKPKRFSGVNPSIEEVEDYIREKNFHVSAEEIIKYYTNHGEYNAWRFRDGKLVKDWHRCCGTFEDGWKKRNQNRFIETKNRISNDDEDDEIAQMRAFMKTLGGARNAANQ